MMPHPLYFADHKHRSHGAEFSKQKIASEVLTNPEFMQKRASGKCCMRRYRLREKK